MADYNPKTLVLEKDSNTYGYASGSFYAECSTAGPTQTKFVTIPEIKKLEAGLSVRIKFTNGQTYDGGQPKLQINSLTAKYICRNGTTAAAKYEWSAGEILDFVYDGTNFIILEGAIPTVNYYGSRVKFSNATDSTSEALAATPRAVKAAYDLANDKANRDEIGIVITGDKASQNVISGQYVIVQNSTISEISDGLYTASSNVSAGTAFTSANLTSVANGGLNTLNDQIGKFPDMAKINLASATSSSIVIPSGSRHIIIATTQNGQGYWMGYVRSTGTSNVGFYDILGNTNSQSLSVTATEATRTITFTQTTARVVNVIDIVCYGTACTAS